MPYKVKKKKCKMKSGEPGSAVRYRKITHCDGSETLRKVACHKSMPSAYAAIGRIHDSHDPAGDVSDELYETVIRRILMSEAVTQADARRVNDILKMVLSPSARAVKKGDHIRVHDDTPQSEEEKLDNAIEIAILGLKMQSPDAINMGKLPSVSRTYPTYRVTDTATGDVADIIFAGTKTSGQRKGGYEYESNLINAFKKAGADAKGGGVVETDIFVAAPAIDDVVGIETKILDARFGQPTLQYDFASSRFLPSDRTRSQEGADLVCNILNSGAEEAEPIHRWMRSIKDTWDSIDRDNPENVPDAGDVMTVYSRQVSPAAYDKFLKGRVRQLSPKVSAPSSLISSYYRKKDADYIQINPFGLFHFDDVLGLNTPSFDAVADNVKVIINVELLTSGQAKVLRATIDMPMSGLPSSNMSLDRAADVEKFIRACWGEDELESAPAEVRTEGVRQQRSLFTEKLSRDDRREVEKITRRAVQDEVGRAVKGDLARLIRAEVDRALGSRSVAEEIETTAEDVLRRLMREMLK